MLQEAKDTGSILAALVAHRATLQRVGVRHLALFGSRARGGARHDSDLDVLVDMDGSTGHSAADCAIADARRELALSGMLSEICGLDVSVVVRGRLTPEFARRIADDLVEVF